MEYYAIRIYRRGARPDGAKEAQLTGQLEDHAGHKKKFHSAEELWRLLVRSGADTGTPPDDN